MSKKFKVIGIIIITTVAYYSLQYGSFAVHYNCTILKDDCPPPIYGAAEIIYRLIIRPPWLDAFDIKPTIFTFTDGRFSFWEGEVNGKITIIRVPENGSPVLQWIFEEKLPRGITIKPAEGTHITQWLENHPEI